jgi:hypothetical protein
VESRNFNLYAKTLTFPFRDCSHQKQRRKCCKITHWASKKLADAATNVASEILQDGAHGEFRIYTVGHVHYVCSGSL